MPFDGNSNVRHGEETNRSATFFPSAEYTYSFPPMGALSIIPGIKVPNPWGKQWNAARRIVICDNYMFPTDFFLWNLFPL